MIKILVVEGEKDIIELLEAIFSDLEDYKVLYTRGGLTALDIARKSVPDMVLMNTQLPDITGYEMCKLLKTDPIVSHTKVVMLSGMTQNSDWDKAMEAGADDCIFKPFSISNPPIFFI